MVPRDAPPKLSLGAALFLDLDGTLAPLAATPDAVPFDARRARMLARLERAMDGAVAVISGRTLGDVERILGPAPRAAAAVHGLVRRRADGSELAAASSPDLAWARAELQGLVRAFPDLILEDKGLSLALHYRQAPQAAEAVRAAAGRICAKTGLVRQDGAMVCEVRSPGPGKGEALAAFLCEAPFCGRVPVMVGDDLTDEAAFAAAAAAGGFGVLVGPARPSAAAYRLADVTAVLAWLAAALASVTA